MAGRYKEHGKAFVANFQIAVNMRSEFCLVDLAKRLIMT